MSTLKLFENQQIRSVWDEDRQVWFFCIVDVIGVLTESTDPSAYWRKLKQRLKSEGNQTVTDCHSLKMQAADGKQRLATTTAISSEKEPAGLEESRVVAQQGGTIAGNTRKEIEEKTGKPIVTAKNAKRLK